MLVLTGLTAIPLDAAASVPNGDFETAGPLGTPVTNTPSNSSGPSAAAGWTQYLLTGNYLISKLEASTDTLSGSCGNILTLRCNSPGNGASSSTVSVNLPTALPVGSRGTLNVKVLTGSALIGFLVNTPTATVFDTGSVSISTPTNVWRQITFTNGTLPAGSIALQLYASSGQEAVIQLDHVTVATPILPRASRYDYAGSFGPAQSWIANFCWTNQVPVVGDFDGDGWDDIATFLRDAYPGQNGDVYVALNRSGQFVFSGLWQGNFGVGSEIPAAGDFDGDGRDDVLVFVPGTGKVWVALSSGNSFCGSREWWNTTTYGPFFYTGELPMVGDVNGDGRADIVTFSRLTKSVYVGLSTGTNFVNAGLWQADFCPGAGEPRVGDVNGDGKADVVCFVRDSRTGLDLGNVEVALSTGTNFAYQALRYWHQHFAVDTNYEPMLADLNGDGSKDIIAVHRDGRVFAAIRTAVNSFASGNGTQTGDPHWQWHPGVRRTNELVLPGHFNNDLNADLAVFSRGERPGADFASTFVSLCGGHAQPEPESRLADFGYATAENANSTNRPLVVLLTELVGTPLSRTTNEFKQGVFGPGHPNVLAYVSEMSNGALTLTNGGFVKIGPVLASDLGPDVQRSIMERAANSDGPGGFEFKNFDANGDGTIENNELTILGISSDTTGWGNANWFDTTIFPSEPARRVRVHMRWAYAGDTSGLHNMAHEIAHTAGMHHLYGLSCRGYGLTVASCTAGGAPTTTDLIHLDPWNKLRMGWVKPLIYDLKDFPAGAAIRPNQSSSDRPVILFDSSRGTHEYFMLEHRNGLLTNGTTTWTAPGGTWRAAVRPTYPAAGYDMDVRDTPGNRQGFLTWAVKTDASHDALELQQGILAGPNGVLNSTRAGDDVQFSSPPQIQAGPDGILQSVAAGDDVYWQDALVLPTSNPADINGRLTNSLNPSGEAATTLRFYDSTDTGVRVRGDAINGNTWQFLEWGRAFRPFIETFAAPTTAKPGDFLIVLGSLGKRSRFYPTLVSTNGTLVPLETTSWTGAGGTFKIPTGAGVGTVAGPRSGHYRFMIFDGTTNQAASNVFPLDLVNVCEDWRATYFTSSELLDPNVSGDAADPDGDRQANLAEYIFGTNPRVANPPPSTGSYVGGQFVFPLHVRADRGCVRITVQSSEDLIHWTDGSHFDCDGSGNPGTFLETSLTLPSVGRPHFFARLVFTRI